MPQGVQVRPLLPAPRQKNSAPFRFRGLRKSRENCTSAESFFLSKSEDSRGSSDLVLNGGCPFWCGKQDKVGSARAKRGGSDGTCLGRGLVPEGEFNHVRRSSRRSVSPVPKSRENCTLLPPSSFGRVAKYRFSAKTQPDVRRGGARPSRAR